MAGLAIATLMTAGTALAQNIQPATSTTDPASGAAACGGCGVMLMIPIALFILNIILLVWVARDAKARGMDSSVVWMLLVMFLSFIGLFIYLGSRPKGDLVSCPVCGNQRLRASAKCPHCGNGWPAPAPPAPV